MRNVTELSKMKGKVYVYLYLKDEVIARKFLRDAENDSSRLRKYLLEED
jgi:chromosome condensin MukBEF MukE localization factor